MSSNFIHLIVSHLQQESINLKNNRNILILGLRLIIEGEAVCKWTESSGTGSNRRTTTYYGEEKYVNSVSYLFGSKDGEPTEVLQGIQTYNFECLLPEPIPYSVEGKHGHVRYKVDVNLDIPWAFDIHEVQPFTVVRCEDLNVWLSDYLWQPQSVEEKKVFCCWFCRINRYIA